MNTPIGGPGGLPYAALSKKQRYLKQKTALWNERSTWDPIWRELSELVQPRSGRFFLSDTNKGHNRYNKIYDSTGLRARRILASGLMSGKTSPAKPWFKLTLPDAQLMEHQNVKIWLKKVTEIMRDIFRASNTYRALPTLYAELAGFGTAAAFLEADYKDVIRHYPTTIGEFSIAQNARGEVDTIYRYFSRPVIEVVGQFGYANCSQRVRNAYDQGNYYTTMVSIIHAVQPRHNSERDLRRKDAANMAWSSCWFEEAQSFGDEHDKLLRESGFKRFPALAPRWSVTGGDVYGDSPGMEALGDLKQLMHEQLRKGQGIDYQTNPPLQVPAAYRGQEHERLPGGIMYYDAAGGAPPIKSAFDVDLRLDHLLADIDDVRMRIDKSFYVDLFLMIANIERSNVTAREIAEKQEEKLLMLGPVAEILDDELLEPLVDFTFDRMVEARLLPPPPRELAVGMPINIEFIGVLAQAQRAVGIGSVDRLLGVVGALAQLRPESLDKLNVDQIYDAYSDMLGVDPEFIIADENVAIIRAQRAQEQQKQLALAAAKPMADTAKTLSETDPNKPSMLQDQQ